MPEWDAKTHALASVTILAMVLVALYVILIQPAMSSRLQFRERYDELQFQLTRLGNPDSKAKQLKRQLDALAAKDADTTGFFEYKPAALAAADLQKHIKILVESSQGSVISTQVIPQKESDIFPRISIKVHLRGNIDALRKILYQLNADRPILFIDNLLIQARHGAGRRHAQRGVDQLEVRFDLTGFMYQTEAS